LATAIFAQGIISARGNPVFIALSLLIAILFSAPFSGGHVNPAVSTAMLFRRQIKLRHYILYSVSQFVGSFCGAGIAWYLLGEVSSPHIDTN
jgi:glycerol uptake facilitator-like aquaporin